MENENKKTFVTILEYLKIKYNWVPERITIDYSRAEKKCINLFISKCRYYTLFFPFYGKYH